MEVLADRVSASLVAHVDRFVRVMLVVVAAALTTTALYALTCTGWDVPDNNEALLALRHTGGLALPWVSVRFAWTNRALQAALAMTGAGLFLYWMENGWGFVQPSSGTSIVTVLPLVAALLPLAIKVPRERLVR